MSNSVITRFDFISITLATGLRTLTKKLLKFLSFKGLSYIYAFNYYIYTFK